jgi:hypothetical protein
MTKKLAVLILALLMMLNVLVWYRLPLARAFIEVGGHIASNTVWKPVDVYRVVNDTFVDVGVVLTVEPSVRVQFGDGFSLIVEGSLNATGTEAEPIVFTSNRAMPNAGAWNTLKFNGSSSERFLLKHSKVEYAVNGATVDSLGLAVINRSEICNCYESGIRIIGRSDVVVQGNSIHDNRHGIASDAVGTQLGIKATGNAIVSNQETGISLKGSEDVCNASLSFNNVSFNGGIGIFFYAGRSISNVTISSNDVLSNVGIGMYLLGYLGNISNVSVCSNDFSFNGEMGMCLISYSNSMFNITISSNKVSSNGGTGIYLTAHDSLAPGSVYDFTLSSNNVSSNSVTGIFVYGVYVYDFRVSSNRIFSNVAMGIYVLGEIERGLLCDLTVFGNVFVTNNMGVVLSAVNGNLTGNSIAYNRLGVSFILSKNNLASFNDVCFNTYGMNVTDGAIVNAEQNYWGDASGPYHPSLNVGGQGNPVNGNGTDLDFVPFQTSPQGYINQRPTAVLSVEKTTADMNETVTFNATRSSDDGRVEGYFFDFGDGANSGWVSVPTVTHRYALKGAFNASLIVRDDLGVLSLNDTSVYVEITIIPESPSILILPLLIIATFLAVKLHLARKPKRL